MGQQYQPGCVPETREGRAAEFWFGARDGTVTRESSGAAVWTNLLEFFALLTALLEMRVTPRAVSMAEVNDDENDDEGKEI